MRKSFEWKKFSSPGKEARVEAIAMPSTTVHRPTADAVPKYTKTNISTREKKRAPPPSSSSLDQTTDNRTRPALGRPAKTCNARANQPHRTPAEGRARGTSRG